MSGLIPTAAAAPRTICVWTVVLATCSAPAHAQQFYVGGELGYTFALQGGRGARNIAFLVELESRGPLGVRFEGNETISLLFLTANVTYAFGPRDAQFQPYLVGGFGVPFEVFAESDYALNAGGVFRSDTPIQNWPCLRKRACFVCSRASRFGIP